MHKDTAVTFKEQGHTNGLVSSQMASKFYAYSSTLWLNNESYYLHRWRNTIADENLTQEEMFTDEEKLYSYYV